MPSRTYSPTGSFLRLGVILMALGSTLPACSSSSSGADSTPAGGTLKMQLALGTAGQATVGTPDHAFRASAAPAMGIESLKYFIGSIQICEDLDVSGSGFQNPRGCLSVYEGDRTAYGYEPSGQDWTPLADHARTSDTGFIDLMSSASRGSLAASTVLNHDHVRSYNYGIINWALPIKVKATVQGRDGAPVYTHDGRTVVEVVGADMFHNYVTLPASSLAAGPAEEAVVLLGNGGNWFKFQAPLVINTDDINERRAWVLDLVFNPDGIVKATSGAEAAQLQERDSSGGPIRGISVPMLDLAPVPHRSTETVMRESYLGHVTVGSNAFDMRVELYSVDGDATHTVYGVDIKTLVSSASTTSIPAVTKASFVESSGDTLSFLSWSHLPFLTGFRRATAEGTTSTASITCATHMDRGAAEGGSAIVVDSCPSPTIDVPFTLVSRTVVAGSTSIGVGGGPDAGGGDAHPD